jgi:hypothetical protein
MGVKTGRTQKQNNAKSLSLPPAALKSGTPVIRDDQKEIAVDRVLQDALTEGGSKAEAVALLEDDKWLEAEAKKVAEANASGFMQRASLKQEIVRTVRKNPPVSDEEVD